MNCEVKSSPKQSISENKRKIEIEEIEEKLEDMIFDMSVKDDENQALKKKVQEAKIELEDARQQIIKVNVLF